MEGKPDIGKPKPGDRPAEEVVEHQSRDPAIPQDEVIAGPNRYPGKNQEEDSYLQAEKEVEDDEGSMH